MQGAKLLQACKEGNVELVKQALADGADPNVRDEDTADDSGTVRDPCACFPVFFALFLYMMVLV
jgi:hypothetical protein